MALQAGDPVADETFYVVFGHNEILRVLLLYRIYLLKYGGQLRRLMADQNLGVRVQEDCLDL